MLQTHMEQAPSTILDLFNKNEKELSPAELSELKELKKASGLYRELYDGAMKAAEPTGENLTPEAAAADKQKAMGREVKKEAAQVDFSKYTSSDLERAIDIASAYEQQLSAYSNRAEAGYEANKDNTSVRDQWEQHIQEANKRKNASESIIQALMAEQQKREMAEAPAEARNIPSTAELAKAEIANIEDRKAKAEAGWPTAEQIQEQMKKDASEAPFEVDESEMKAFAQEKAQEKAGWPTAEAIQAEMKNDSVKFKEPKFDIDVVEPNLKQWDKEAKAEAGWPTAEQIQEQMKKDSGMFKEVVHPVEGINILEAKPEPSADLNIDLDESEMKAFAQEKAQEKAGWPTAEQIQKQMEADHDKEPHTVTAQEKAWMEAGDNLKNTRDWMNKEEGDALMKEPMPKIEGVIYEEGKLSKKEIADLKNEPMLEMLKTDLDSDAAMTPDTVENIRDLMGAGLLSEREADKALDELESGNEQEKSSAREKLKKALDVARKGARISWRLLGTVSDILRDSAVLAAKVGAKTADIASKIKV